MSNNKSVLIFTDWYEPGFKAGGPIRSCRNIVSALSGHFNFYIVTSDRDLGDNNPYPGISTNRWIKSGEGHHIYYASPGSLTSSVMKKMVHYVRPATIYLNSLFSPRFTIRPLLVLNKMKYSGRIVLAPRGMLKKSALAHKPWKKKIFLWLSAVAGLRNRVVFHATDEQERTDILEKIGAASRVVVAENIPAMTYSHAIRNKQPGKLRIIYLSRIHPVKNLLYALETLSMLENVQGIEFDIYGSSDDEIYYTKCFNAARKLEGRMTIQFLGEVEHNEVSNLLHGYHLFFVPTRGENFGHAIFEALASGCPVLISDQTPWKDVEDNGVGWVIPLDQKRKFVDAICQMHGMPQNEFSNLSSRAARYAENRYSTGEYKEKYLHLFGTGLKLI